MGILYWAIFIYVLYKVYRIARYFKGTKRSEQIAKEYAEKKAATKYTFEKVEEDKIDLILGAKSVSELRDLQIEGKVSCFEIVSTYCERAYTHGRENCLTADEYFTQALEEAKERDIVLRKLKEQGKDLDQELPSLHGIPFSVKDMLYLKGTVCSLGTGTRT